MAPTKTFFFLITALFASSILFAQTPGFEWQLTWNSSQAVHCREIAIDSDGNIYVSGNFRATVDLDPGAGVVNATSAGSYNGFLVKLTAQGAYLWSIAYPVELWITDMKISALGDVLMGGSFRSPVDFDPGPGTVTLTNNGLSDGFLARYTSNGELLWAKSFGSVYNDGVRAINEAPNGEIIVAGDFVDVTDFDPGAGETILISTGVSSTDGFFSRFDANGNFISVTPIGGVNSNDVSAASVDIDGNIILVGRFSGSILFDPNGEAVEFTSEETDMFVAKYNSGGEFIWAKAVTGQNNLNVGSAEVDAQSITYITGFFAGDGDFDPGDGELLLTDPTLMGELFIMKLDVDGNLVWAHQLGVPEAQEFGMELSVDANQNLFLTGIVTGNVDFDLGPDVVNLPGSTLDAFVLVMNSNAEFVWASRFGNNQDDFGQKIIPYADGSVYVCGHRFPSGDSPHSFGYLYKYSTSSLNSSSAHLQMFGIEIYPNPSEGIVKVTAKDEIKSISVFDIAGKELGRYTPSATHTNIDLSLFETGVYLLQITTGNMINAVRVLKE